MARLLFDHGPVVVLSACDSVVLSGSGLQHHHSVAGEHATCLAMLLAHARVSDVLAPSSPSTVFHHAPLLSHTVSSFTPAARPLPSHYSCSPPLSFMH